MALNLREMCAVGLESLDQAMVGMPPILQTLEAECKRASSSKGKEQNPKTLAVDVLPAIFSDRSSPNFN